MARPKRQDGKSARNQAIMKYCKDNYDRIAINTKKGNREILKDFTEKQGYSINGYINMLLSENVPNFKL